MSVSILTPVGALLALVGVVPLLALRAGERRARGVAQVLGLPAGSLPRAAAVAIAMVAVLLGLAATQPVLVREGGDLVRTDAEVYVVFDTSQSMLAAISPEGPTRFERGQALAMRLGSEIDDVPFGIASLTDRVLPHLFPTPDRNVYAATIERSMDVENPPPDRDWVGRATTFAALSALATRNFYSSTATSRVAVVLTDGESRPYSFSTLAGDLGGSPAIVPIVVHVSREGERLYIGRNLDRSYAPDSTSRESLAALARATGGSVFGEEDVRAIVRATRAALGKGDVAPSGRERTSTALAPWLFLLATLPCGFLIGRRIL
jgi:hypothetical protein